MVRKREMSPNEFDIPATPKQRKVLPDCKRPLVCVLSRSKQRNTCEKSKGSR